MSTFESSFENIDIGRIKSYRDPDGSLKISEETLSSANFDGEIPAITASVAVSELKEGQLITFDSGSALTYYPIIRIDRQDPDLEPVYTGEHTIYYLQDNKINTASYSASNTKVIITYEDWETKNIGTSGWLITQQGNAIFSNVAVRGDLEATTLDVGGANGIVYDGTTVTIGSSVVINSTLTTDSLQVGASPSLLRIANNVSGSNSGIFISSANYWYSTGQFSLGGPQGVTFNSGSVVIGTDVYVNAGVTVNALTVGTVPNILKISASPNGVAGNDGIYINSDNYWFSNGYFGLGSSVNNVIWNGTNLRVTGSISATNITASVGNIAGFTLSNNSLSATNIVLSSSVGLRLGPSNQFSVDQSGNLVATTASITGRINATSGSFSGDITASAGRFVGALSVSSSGAIYAGTNVDSGQRTVLNASGLFGYHSNGVEAFALPVSGSPRLGTFTIVPTGIVSQSASNANMIYGNVDSSGSVTDGIVIRGFRTSGASAAIYTVQNGVETSYAAGNGFYVDENAKFKLKGATGSLAFDGNDLYVSGNINATSGQFTGSVVAQHITASTGTVGGFILTASSITDLAVTASTVGMTTGPTAFFAGANDQIGTNAQFRVTQTGSIFANAASITGDIIATTITSSVGDIGGWTLSASTLTGNSASLSAAGSIKLGSLENIVALSSTDTNRIWAGSAVSTTAPFRVSSTGFLTATGASITGDITAQSGTFTGSISAQFITASIGRVGGFVLSASSLTASPASGSVVGVTTGASAIFVGATSLTGAGAPFWVSSTGSIFASNATITGDITATNITSSVGRVGGFLLSASSLTASTSTVTAVGITTGASAIFAGATARTGTGAKFWVSNAGVLYAQSASIVGDSVINGTNIGNGNNNVSSNLRVGTNALGANTSGQYNLALGDYALASNTTGYNNIAIGASALNTSTGGSDNLAIGYQAMQNANSAVYNMIAIGNTAGQTARSNAYEIVAIGFGAAKNVNSNNIIAIGTDTAPNATNQFNIAIGARSLTNITSGISNNAIGSDALGYVSTGGYNVALGDYSGYGITTGNRNIAIGFSSINFIGAAGNNNVAIGVASQYNLTSGDQNITIGSSAGYTLATGTENIIIGTLSGRLIAGGDFNVVIGDNAGTGIVGGSNNIVLGSNAFTGVNGSNNTVIGKGAYNNATTGSANVALGYRAGTNHTSGNYTVYLGYEGTAVTTSSNVYIGAGTALGLRIDSAQNVIVPNDLTVDTNTLYVDSTNNRVGIGTTGPTNTLTVIGTASVSNNSKFGGDLTVLGSSNEFAVYDGSTYALRVISGNGGATASIGSVRSNAVYERTTTTAANQNIDASFFFRRVVASSQQWKKDIVDLSLDESLQSVLNIRPVKFKFIDGYISEDDSRFNLDVPGFIAEEVNIASPIVADKEDGKPSDWNPKILIPMMVKVIQHQQTQIEELYARINQLEGGQ